MLIRLTFVLFLVNFVTAKENGESCVTPNGETAKCIPVKTCQVILDAISTKNSSIIAFVKKSQCGYEKEPLVCCGTLGYQNIQSRTLANAGNNILPNKTICGTEKLMEKIVNGEKTEIGEFPWMAALEYKNQLSGVNIGIKCGGSVITDRYVLTAAHCINPVGYDLTKVILGEWNTATDPDCQKLIAITECANPVLKFNTERKIPHPRYNPTSGAHDIGLLRLDNRIPYTDYIRPICLLSANQPEHEINTRMIVSGWGNTENHQPSNIKLKVEIPLQSIDTCTNKLKVRITDNQLCAGGENNKDSCHGDSGGPLMKSYKDPDTAALQWYLEGVVSWGKGCGGLGYPAVYTRVSKYIDWILETVS